MQCKDTLHEFSFEHIHSLYLHIILELLGVMLRVEYVQTGVGLNLPIVSHEFLIELNLNVFLFVEDRIN